MLIVEHRSGADLSPAAGPGWGFAAREGLEAAIPRIRREGTPRRGPAPHRRVGLAVIAIVFRAVAGLTTSLEVSGWGAAFLAALLVKLAALGSVLLIPYLGELTWVQWTAFGWIVETVAVIAAALLAPGVKLRGVVGIALVVVGIRAVDYGVSLALGG